MLLTKKRYDVGDLISLKLITSEEIIARLKEETDTAYTIERPVTLVPTSQGTAIAPYMITADVAESIVVDKSKVITVAITKKEIETAYIEATTGISTINSNIVG